MPALPSGINVFIFRSRFPEIAADPNQVNDADIQVALVAATQIVDPTVWNTGDYQIAVLYWAAHFLTLKLWQQASAEVGGAGTTDLFIRSISFGDRRVMFGERKTATSQSEMVGPGESMLELTIYGQLFLQLRTRNIAAVAIV